MDLITTVQLLDNFKNFMCRARMTSTTTNIQDLINPTLANAIVWDFGRAFNIKALSLTGFITGVGSGPFQKLNVETIFNMKTAARTEGQWTQFPQGTAVNVGAFDAGSEFSGRYLVSDRYLHPIRAMEISTVSLLNLSYKMFTAPAVGSVFNIELKVYTEPQTN